jgi:phenylpropionate dioxygenase-like ring-hydroxylating dioxygenase large terminal subunit
VHCARSFPVQVAQGLIWVWGLAGSPQSNVALEAFLKKPLLVAELDDAALKDRVIKGKWNFRDLPYGWDMFMENTLDPAHVAVSHHNIVGNR